MGKKVWKKLAACIAVMSMILCMLPVSAFAQEDTPETYVALGDSITSGYGLSEDESAFPALVAETCGLTLDNQGIAGATSADLLAGLGDGSLKVAGADVVTITVGGNDLMDALYTYLANQYNASVPGGAMTAETVQTALMTGDTAMLAFAMGVVPSFASSTEAKTALAGFGVNLAGIIKAIRLQNQEAMIIFVTQYNPYKYFAEHITVPLEQIKTQAQALASAFELGVQAMNAVILQTEGQAGCFVADGYGVIAAAEEDPCNAAFDMASMKFNLDFHPNAYGHQLIAEEVSGVVNTIKQLSAALEAQIAVIQGLTALTEVDQETAETEESAKAWAETLISGVLAEGVTAEVQIVDFEAAQAGDKENAEGKDGSFKIAVSLAYGEFEISDAVVIDTRITAEEYTEPEPPKTDLPYTDVDEDSWFYDEAKYAYEKGLMTGMDETTFGPEIILPRAQFATILYRMEGEPETEFEEKFLDVADGQFYTLPVMWAEEAEVVTGYTNGNFGPSDPINREQMATMMFRYANYLGLDTSQRTDDMDFPDVSYVSDFAQEAMSWCVANEIITGDNGNLNPQGETNRAVCATIITRFYECYGL